MGEKAVQTAYKTVCIFKSAGDLVSHKHLFIGCIIGSFTCFQILSQIGLIPYYFKLFKTIYQLISCYNKII